MHTPHTQTKQTTVGQKIVEGGNVYNFVSALLKIFCIDVFETLQTIVTIPKSEYIYKKNNRT